MGRLLLCNDVSQRLVKCVLLVILYCSIRCIFLYGAVLNLKQWYTLCSSKMPKLITHWRLHVVPQLLNQLLLTSLPLSPTLFPTLPPPKAAAPRLCRKKEGEGRGRQGRKKGVHHHHHHHYYQRFQPRIRHVNDRCLLGLIKNHERIDENIILVAWLPFLQRSTRTRRKSASGIYFHTENVVIH